MDQNSVFTDDYEKAKEEYEVCDKYKRMVMVGTGEVFFLSYYTIEFFSFLLSLLGSHSPLGNAILLNGLDDNSPEMLNEFFEFCKCSKEVVKEVFGEHNSIKNIMKNEVDNTEEFS